MTSGFVLVPGEGPAYGFHGSAVVIKASGEHTSGCPAAAPRQVADLRHAV